MSLSKTGFLKGVVILLAVASFAYGGYSRGYKAGYQGRIDFEQSRLYTRWDVGIVHRYDPTHYMLRIDGRNWSVDFCTPPTFEPLEKLEHITYFNAGPCWSLDAKGTEFRYYKQDGETVKFPELLEADSD